MKNTVAVLVLLVASLGAQWEPEQRLTDDPAMTFLTNQNAWSVAATGDTLHVIFVDNRLGKFHVYHTRSLDNGTTWDSAFCLSADSQNVLYSALAASGSNVHVSWTNSQYDRLLYRRSTNAGVSWDSPDTLVYTPRGIDRPSLAASGGGVYAAWSDGRHGTGIWGETYFKRSTDGGANWEADIRVSPDVDSTLNKEPCVAVSGSYVHLVWYRQKWQQYNALCWYARSTDGGATWQPRTQVSGDASNQQQPVVAAAGPNVHVCWGDDLAAGGLFCRSSSNNGSNWGPNTAINPTAGYGDLPTIAAAGRNVHAAWRHVDNGQFDVGYAHSTDNGATWLPETLLTNDVANNEAPSLAAVGSRVHLTYHTDAPGNYEAYYKQNPTGSGLAEGPTPQAPGRKPAATIVRGSLLLPEVVSGERLAAHICLLNVTGREVMELRSGANDVSQLATGVYFVREQSVFSSRHSGPSAVSREPLAVHKIVVTR